MITRKFKPNEILFAPTARCNLRCAHCDSTMYRACLPTKTAVTFLAACAHAGIKRVGFTGGEPFLRLDFVCALTREAIRQDMLFSRIMTNAAWFKTKKQLNTALTRLFRAGYDGDICISVDALHRRQDLRKVVSFIHTAAALWNRPDIISVSVVKGALDNQTNARLKTLARLLRARVTRNPNGYFIKNKDLFIKIFYIGLSPIGKATHLKNPWDGTWFKDDFCTGPGNVFFVLPNGLIKPCCGYGNDSDIFTLGSIRDTPKKLLRNAQKNCFVSNIFSTGLHPIRRALERSGIRFPGKTSNHCFFCHYLATYIPKPLLMSAIRSSIPKAKTPGLA